MALLKLFEQYWTPFKVCISVLWCVLSICLNANRLYSLQCFSAVGWMIYSSKGVQPVESPAVMVHPSGAAACGGGMIVVIGASSSIAVV